MSTARIARDHCLAPERVNAPIQGGRYRRLFADLPALLVDEGSLHALGRPGGPCDVGVDFADDDAGTDAAPAAVWPFFGQFVAHDITADRSPLAHRADPEQIRNFRSPKANLEGVYGVGPVGSPYLYAKDDPAKLLLDPGGHDVPRNHEGTALLGDPRNDSPSVHEPAAGGVHRPAQPPRRPPARGRARRSPRCSRRRAGRRRGTTSTSSCASSCPR